MDDKTTFAELKNLVEEFIQEREWPQFHSPKNLSMALAIEAAELMDIFKWKTIVESMQEMETAKTREAVVEEIADIMIYAIALANRNDIDLSTAIREKMVKNDEKYPSDVYKGRY